MVTRKENNAPCSKNFTNKTCWYSFTKQVVVIFGGFSYNSINVPKMLSHLVVKTNNELIIWIITQFFVVIVSIGHELQAASRLHTVYNNIFWEF